MEALVVGDRIVIRTVDEMLESGLFDHGSYGDIILEPMYSGMDFGFNKRMQYLCGQTGVISQIVNGYTTEIKIEFDDPSITLERDDGNDWYISPGMIKLEESVMSDEDLTFFLNEF
jgi:hypothetical protein